MAVSQIVNKEKLKSKTPLERLSDAMDIAKMGASVAGQITDWTKYANLNTTPTSTLDYAKYRQTQKPTLGGYGDQLSTWADKKGMK